MDPGVGKVIQLLRFADAWWMVTAVPESDLSVVWRGDDTGLWEVMPGWDDNGMPWGGMTIGSWVLEEDGSRSDGLLIASCCQAWGWNSDGQSEPIDVPVPSFAVVQDLAVAPSDPQGRVWIASTVGGVVTWVPQPVATSVPTRTNRPDGPPNSAVRRMDCWNDNLWVATGAVSASWTPQYRSDGLFQYSNRTWLEPTLPDNQNDIGGIKDILDVSIDPTDPSHVAFSSYEEGIIELRDGEVVRVLNAENSSITTSEVGGSPRSAVSGIDFDTDGNLWFTTPWTTNCLHVMLPDGSTVGMNLGDEGQNLLFSDVEVTRDGYVWAVLPRGNGVLVYDPAGTPGNPNDDNWTILTTTPDEEVCLPMTCFALRKTSTKRFGLAQPMGHVCFTKAPPFLAMMSMQAKSSSPKMATCNTCLKPMSFKASSLTRAIESGSVRRGQGCMFWRRTA